MNEQERDIQFHIQCRPGDVGDTVFFRVTRGGVSPSPAVLTSLSI